MRFLALATVAALAATLTNINAQTPATPPASAPAAAPAPAGSLFDLTANSLDGKPVDLSQYKGKVVLVVNVASKCGFTPEYAALEKLYTDDTAKGLVILGFPSNDFKQEPVPRRTSRRFARASIT